MNNDRAIKHTRGIVPHSLIISIVIFIEEAVLFEYYNNEFANVCNNRHKYNTFESRVPTTIYNKMYLRRSKKWHRCKFPELINYPSAASGRFKLQNGHK